MCTNTTPRYNYGQAPDSPFNPSRRDEVYQQVARARSDPGFASFFAWDIMSGKPDTGDYFYTSYVQDQYADDPNGGTRKTGQQTVFEKHRQEGGDGDGYLYANHQLNASKSWVPQAFDYPVMKGEDGGWYRAERYSYDPQARSSMADSLFKTSGQQSFKAGEQVTDATTIRLLNAGHYAFSAKGARGEEVFIPWAEGFAPRKGGKEKAEAGNDKQQQTGSGRDAQMVGASTATPGNVIGGGASLLGNSQNLPDRKTLLGK